jgi:hypothetical protein
LLDYCAFLAPGRIDVIEEIGQVVVRVKGRLSHYDRIGQSIDARGLLDQWEVDGHPSHHIFLVEWPVPITVFSNLCQFIPGMWSPVHFLDIPINLIDHFIACFIIHLRIDRLVIDTFYPEPYPQQQPQAENQCNLPGQPPAASSAMR